MSALNRKPGLRSGHSWWPLAGIALVCLVLGSGAEEAREWGRYEREAIEAGETWPFGCLWVLLGSIIGIDAGLYLLQPGVAWYVGLSGVLHGVIAAGSLSLLGRDQTKFGLVIAAALITKLSFEQGFGPLPFTQSASGGGPVVISAHLYGAVGGMVAVVPALLRRLFFVPGE